MVMIYNNINNINKNGVGNRVKFGMITTLNLRVDTLDDEGLGFSLKSKVNPKV